MPTSTLLQCSHCGASLRIASGHRRPGASAKCPKCHQPVRLPEEPGAPTTQEIQCQICGALLRLRSDRRPAAGGTAKCPKCSSRIDIPPLRAAAGPGAPSGGPIDSSVKPSPAAPGDEVMPAGISPRTPGPASALPPASEPPQPKISIGAGAGASPQQPAPPPLSMSAEEAASGPPPPEGTPPLATMAPPVPKPEMPGPAVERTASVVSALSPPPDTSSGAQAGVAAPSVKEPRIEIQGEDRQALSLVLPTAAAAAAPRSSEATVGPQPKLPTATPLSFWTVEIGSELLQPGGVATLRHWARQGKLQPDDRVRRGSGEWQAAREVPELASILARAHGSPSKAAPAPRRWSPQLRSGLLAGIAGGAVAVVPVLGLLAFSSELEEVSKSWEISVGRGAMLLACATLLMGLAIGWLIIAFQAHYETRGEVLNMWSASGTGAIGTGLGLLCGVLGIAFWPHTSWFALLLGFLVYGAGLGLLVLVCYRSLFQDRKN
ncbi:MAG: hypothetical protein V3U98_10960 [Acidobacteriota bacterium]